MPTPLIKWVGGKSNLAQSIISQYPEQINNYHEPFVGGGATLLAFLRAISDERIKHEGIIYASDANPLLIQLYQTIRDYPNDLIYHLQTLTQGHQKSETPKDYYYEQRKRFNTENLSISEKSGLFIYLNKVCFRGIYRLNSNGVFNVPYGHYSNPKFPTENEIQNFSEAIQDVLFNISDFRESLDSVKENDLIYIDPPYVPLNNTSFTAYTSDTFNMKDHDELFDKCNDISSIANIVMSNSDTQKVRNAFESWNVYPIQVRRAINSKNPASSAGEVILSNI